MNIAVFGGSFDPPHVGHLAIIEKALKELPIERLFVVPAFINPFKKGTLFPASLRLEWMRRLTKHHPEVAVIDFEIQKGCPTPTIETIRHLKEHYTPKNLYLIIGSDQLPDLPKWHSIEELKKQVEFVIITREERAIPPNFRVIELNNPSSSTKIRTKDEEDSIPESIKGEVLSFMKNHKESLLRKERAQEIVEILDSKKAENIELFDLSGSDYLVDYVVIATALADKHAASLLDTLKTELKPKGETFYATEESDNWIVTDLGDIMIHLFTENHRKKFNLEEFLAGLKKEKNRSL